jgi:AcrR family transcriptional regulator
VSPAAARSEGKPPRRTQAQRSADTRARLLETTIRCLHERGYAATTTMLVIEQAGVSRGAMLHQFPTRVDLMLFVVREAYAEELALYGELMDAIAEPTARIAGLPEIVQQVLSRPAGVAVLEIMMGSRSDPELAERLGALQQEIEARSLKVIGRYETTGTRPFAPALVRLVVWAIRGLSLAQMLTGDADATAQSVKLFGQLLEAAPASSNPRT